MKKNIALIGAGPWGKNHLRNLYELGVLHSVLDTSSAVITHRKKSFPQVNFSQDEATVIHNTQVEGVVIAAPASLHYPLAKKFLLAGKDVLVEKPLALTMREGRELIDLATQQKKILMVGHILQYHSAVIKLKRMVDAGELGIIRYIYSNRLNIGKLRTEENVLWSFAPHDISLILMFMNGQQPRNIKAEGGAYINPDIYDTTLTSFDFDNGVKAHVFVSWLHPFKEQKLVVVGSEKMAVFDDVSEEKLRIYPHRIDFTAKNIPVAHRVESYMVKFKMKEPMQEELRHFLSCIKSRQIPKTDGIEGLKVLKVLEEAEKSLKKKIHR